MMGFLFETFQLEGPTSARLLAEPLDRAAGRGQYEAMKMLIARGADAKFVVGYGSYQAAIAGFWEAVKLLIEHGADVQKYWMVNAIETAEQRGVHDVVKLAARTRELKDT